MKRSFGWLALSLLSACSGPTFQYEEAKSNTPDPPGALRFSLQKLSILVDKPTSSSKSTKSNDNTTSDTNSGTPVDACKGLKPNYTYDQCLAGVNPVPSSVPDNLNGRFVAVPNNSPLQKTLGATQISGTTVSGTNYLYKQVSINYASNVKNIITSAGAGATTGFALGGPLGLGVGAGAGLVIGAISPALVPAAPPPPPQPLSDIRASICPEDLGPQSRDPVNWQNLSSKKPQIALGLPVVLQPSSLPNFPATQKSQTTSCWHPVPNALRGAGKAPTPKAFTTPDAQEARDPEGGDGWFYRIYFPKDEDTLPGAADGTKIQSTLIRNMPNDQFPSSYCRPNAYLQITWWTEITQGGKAVPYRIGTIPDPNYFQVVNVPYTGNINFNSICGASASSGNGPDYTGYWDAVTQQINTVQSAVQKANSTSGSGSH
jgi:hypothetical protein